MKIASSPARMPLTSTEGLMDTAWSRSQTTSLRTSPSDSAFSNHSRRHECYTAAVRRQNRVARGWMTPTLTHLTRRPLLLPSAGWSRDHVLCKVCTRHRGGSAAELWNHGRVKIKLSSGISSSCYEGYGVVVAVDPNPKNKADIMFYHCN